MKFALIPLLLCLGCLPALASDLSVGGLELNMSHSEVEKVLGPKYRLILSSAPTPQNHFGILAFENQGHDGFIVSFLDDHAFYIERVIDFPQGGQPTLGNAQQQALSKYGAFGTPWGMLGVANLEWEWGADGKPRAPAEDSNGYHVCSALGVDPKQITTIFGGMSIPASYRSGCNEMLEVRFGVTLRSPADTLVPDMHVYLLNSDPPYRYLRLKETEAKTNDQQLKNRGKTVSVPY